MDITNGRSMELFRHLGVADELRKVAVPEDHPFDVSWVTKLSGWELARFEYPTVAQRRALIRERNNGTLPLEPAMRVSQALLEPALKNILETRAPQIDIRYGWALHTFRQDADGVDAVIRSLGDRRNPRCPHRVPCWEPTARARWSAKHWESSSTTYSCAQWPHANSACTASFLRPCAPTSTTVKHR